MLTNDTLAKRYKQAVIIITLMAFGVIYLLLFYYPGQNDVPEEKKTSADIVRLQPMVTGSTTRIYGRNLYENICAITQTAYPATCDANRPSSIILTREDRKAEAILAVRLSHGTVNAPVLYTRENEIPPVIWSEMERLNPKGIYTDKNTKVILVGSIGDSVKEKIKNKGWSLRHIPGDNPFDLARNIDDYLSTMKGNHSDLVLAAPVEEPEWGLVQAAWSAQKGEGFFFISRDFLHTKVREALKKRLGGAYIYILGPKTGITPQVYRELSSCGHVQIIPGAEDLYGQSAAFSAYHDEGKNFGWWIRREPREFGWGITKPGYNFIFVNPSEWQTAVTASVLARRGRTGPMLLVKKNSLPEEVRSYLKNVQPAGIEVQDKPRNHGWIIGGTDLIEESLQLEIDALMGSDRGDKQ